MSELIKFYHPEIFRSPDFIPPGITGFLMISGGIEVNEFAQICLTLEVKFDKDPLLT